MNKSFLLLFFKKEVLAVLLPFCWLFVTISLQLLAGAYGNDFGGNSDEAAHFVTAVMVRDYLLSGDYAHPLAFAKSFYLHYPKVAFGQWPPLLYALLGGWMILFGASRTAALAMIAVAAAATATLMVVVGRPRLGRLPALLAALLFLASPLVQESTARVMTEQVVTLLALASALQFARYVESRRAADAWLFGLLAALSILTRGSAWGLALVPGLTILLTRRFDLLRRASLWLSAVPVLVLCVPWYAATAGGVSTSWAGTNSPATYWMIAVPFYGVWIWRALGPVVTLLALLGLWQTLARPYASRGSTRAVDPVWAALAALMAATLIMACVVPTGMDERFMVAVLPELALFAAGGLAPLAQVLATRWPRPNRRSALCLAAAATFLAGTFTIPRSRLQLVGYTAAEQRLAALTGPQPAASLLITDEKGDGGIIAAAAVDHVHPGNFMLRGSKLLVHEDWLGHGTQDLYPTMPDLERLLNAIPISSILLDSTIPDYRRRAYQSRVRDLVAGNPQTWQRVATLSVEREGITTADALQIYQRRPAAIQPVDQALLARLIFATPNR